MAVPRVAYGWPMQAAAAQRTKNVPSPRGPLSYSYNAQGPQVRKAGQPAPMVAPSTPSTYGSGVRSASATYTTASASVPSYTSARSSSAAAAPGISTYRGGAHAASNTMSTSSMAACGGGPTAPTRSSSTASQVAAVHGQTPTALSTSSNRGHSGPRTAAAPPRSTHPMVSAHTARTVNGASVVTTPPGAAAGNSVVDAARVAKAESLSSSNTPSYATTAVTPTLKTSPRPVASADDESDDDVIAPGRLFSTNKRMLLIATINFIHQSITHESVEPASMPHGAEFKLFQEAQYHQSKPSTPYIDPFTKTLHDITAGHVTEFILMLLHRGYFDVSEFIISVIYLLRFRDQSGICLHTTTWRPLFVTSLLLADKMWEDKSVKNSSLTMLFPVLSNAELFELEVVLLEHLRFTAWVSRSEFQKFCETLMRTESSAQISSQVLSSEFVAALDAGSEPPSKKEAAAPKPQPQAVPAKVPLKDNHLQHPWNARKTVHGTNPSAPMAQRLQVGQPGVRAGGKPVRYLQSNGVGDMNDLDATRNGITPRHGQERRTNSEPRVGAAANQAVRCYAPNGQQTPAQPREAPQAVADSRLQTNSYSQERRPNSEPRIVAPTAMGNTRYNVGRPPPSVAGAAGQQTRPSASQAQGAASPRRERTGMVAGQEVSGPASERSASESATIGRPQVQSLAQAAQHSRSTSAVAQASRPLPQAATQQRSGYPFAPSARSTVPMPAAASRTAHPGQPMPARQPQAPHTVTSSGIRLGASMAGAPGQPNNAILGRGRSSSPAGITESGYAPPPSARRNVAAPPMAVRQGGLRIG